MKQKIDIHQEVTDRFIAALEAGTQPWQMDWISAAPKRSCKTPYQGINILLLGMAQEAGGYTNPHWLTFNQAKSLGGMVRKGEKGARIVFYKRLSVDAKEGERADADGKRSFGFLKFYTVFNVEQCDDLPADKFPLSAAPMSEEMRDAVAEEALRSTGATIREGGGAAYYTETTDSVHMPDFTMFKSVSGYLATLAHELIHWTGPAKRLARPMFKDYAKGRTHRAEEELVAEIGAAFVCARLGIAGDHFESHAAYVASWLKALKNDKRAIFKAAALAQTAADMVLENADTPPSIKAPATPAPTPAPVMQIQPQLQPQGQLAF